MFQQNPYFQNLKSDDLFQMIDQKRQDFLAKNQVELLNLGIGDITFPLPKRVGMAIQKAIQEMEQKAIGYGPECGYPFLKQAIQKKWAKEASLDEIFISDGAKSHTAYLQELFSKECRIGLMDPVYPAYLKNNQLENRKIILMPCQEENGFIPQLPKERVDVIYLCHPQNPTGVAFTYEALKMFVDFALEHQILLIVDVAYNEFITDGCPKSIYEIPGAKQCAIEIGSFSKSYGFTGLRLGYTIVPKSLFWPLNSLFFTLLSIKSNGVSYPIQKGGQEALKLESAAKKIMQHTHLFKKALEQLGFKVFGGINCPYIWLKAEKGSWQLFDHLLQKAHILCIPGIGFGACGQGFVRLSGFATQQTLEQAPIRLQNALFSYR
jgi:LL-diaminopimelate aminotransferase